ncbi:hypothetical protein JZ751_018952, partial [Albula glossodonta]
MFVKMDPDEVYSNISDSPGIRHEGGILSASAGVDLREDPWGEGRTSERQLVRGILCPEKRMLGRRTPQRVVPWSFRSREERTWDTARRKSENLYQNVRLKPIGAHATSPAASPGSQSAGGKSSAQRDCVWKRTSLLFISLWIITLISLITTLGLYFKQSSALPSELTEQQRNSSIHIT